MQVFCHADFLADLRGYQSNYWCVSDRSLVVDKSIFFGVMLRFEIDLGISWDSRIEHYTGDMFQFEISTEVAIFHFLGTVFIGETWGR